MTSNAYVSFWREFALEEPPQKSVFVVERKEDLCVS